ncbi:uncharacterized protein UV8b_00777 [Ustilaginoidea virens]|uniref:Uncharacterized protein n=1 Tax=Ustilaginoidea virens TaxID=1159556 RepID=A0A8E5MEM9_USTVR|nr:uncharacterized protein UV8b_00777 [Ustilaginoidea virens]QUC16536.1 hypothetical protein UV8b_00777 [Ustilaginoidea virens]
MTCMPCMRRVSRSDLDSGSKGAAFDAGRPRPSACLPNVSRVVNVSLRTEHNSAPPLSQEVQ